MANGDFFDEFLRNASNYNGGEPEVYEDTHDANGNYTGGFSVPPQQQAYMPQQPYTPPQQPPQYMQGVPPQASKPMYTPPPQSPSARRTESSLEQQIKFTGSVQQANAPQPQPMPLPTLDQYISPQLNQNFVIYRPRTTKDVEQLIAYLRRREPALVDLDPIADSPDAQRLMDFTSGAAYALGDRVMAIRRNLFLITPDTIDVLKPDGEE